ncbi:MAG: hypothetical protein IT429_16895, partial [Gemmataceae bacterium]|nr:hypothetical protein [Gemmataceae bacterium]
QEGRCPACGQTLAIPNSAGGGPLPPPWPQAAPPPLPTVLPADEKVPQEVAPDQPPAGDQPPAPLTDHGNGPIPPDADFFVPPPREIGELLSAYTSMRQGDEPWPVGARAAWSVLAAAVGVLLGVLIDVVGRVRNPAILVFWPLLFASIGVLIVLLATRFKRACSYVGREGVARFACAGRRDTLTRDEVFLFRDALELRTSQTRHYTNGVYQGTNYSYTWTDVSGLTRYVLASRHNSEQGTPKHTHEFHLAASAEFAWTMHLLGQLEAQLTLGGAVTFNVNKNDWVRVSPGHLRFALKGETFDCPVNEIREARVEQGMFVIKRTDAREGWFSSSGVFKFPYSTLANAQLFLILLDKVAGVRLN